MESPKKILMGMTLAELKAVAGQLGMPAFTGKQMAEWLYKRQVKPISLKPTGLNCLKFTK